MNDEVNSFEFERDNSNFCIFGKKSPFAIESRDKSHVILVDIAKIGIIIPCDTPEIGEMNCPNSNANFLYCVYK